VGRYTSSTMICHLTTAYIDKKMSLIDEALPYNYKILVWFAYLVETQVPGFLLCMGYIYRFFLVSSISLHLL